MKEISDSESDAEDLGDKPLMPDEKALKISSIKNRDVRKDAWAKAKEAKKKVWICFVSIYMVYSYSVATWSYRIFVSIMISTVLIGLSFYVYIYRKRKI